MNQQLIVHPALAALPSLLHPAHRFILGNIPIYYLQVPRHVVDAIRGPDAPSPPLWGAGIPPQDPDGQYTWRIFFSNYVVIYIRSQPIPSFGRGLWTISPDGSEIFIPQSLLRFEIRELNPASPPALPMLEFPSHANIPTLLSPQSTHNFQGRRCKRCQGQHVHNPRCPSLRHGYECGWCRAMNGAHHFNCNGFMP